MSIRTRLSRRRRGTLALGVGLGLLASGGLATAGSAPAYAGVAPATHVVSAGTAADVPGPHSPLSGRTVAGAVYGRAAEAAAGSLATGFRTTHRAMLDAVHGAGTTRPGAQLHDWWGAFPDTGSGPGGMATQSIDPGLRLSKSGDILYAPTMKPADGSCIEVVTVHSTGVPQVWAWDWCNAIAPGAEVDVNSAFLAKYTTTVNGRRAYTQMNKQTNKSANTWTSYLYNYTTKAWDKLFSSSGTDQSGLSYGWDMFEFYSSIDPSTGDTYVCGDIAKAGLVVESSGLQIENASGTWTAATPANSAWQPEAHPDPSTYKCPAMVFTIVSNDNDWTVSVG